MGRRVSIPWVTVAEVGAAAALGGACAFAVARVPLASGTTGGVAAAAALTCGVVFLVTLAALTRIAGITMHPVGPFEVEPIPALETDDAELGELLLTSADRVGAELADEPGSADPEELLLDDILAELRPDARVVRLFDVNAMPTPGELQFTIDRHLNASGSRSAPPDASDALHQALAELRRSLR